MQTTQCQLNTGIYILGKYYALEEEQSEWLYVKRAEAFEKKPTHLPNNTLLKEDYFVTHDVEPPPKAASAEQDNSNSDTQNNATENSGGYMSYITSFFSTAPSSSTQNDPLDSIHQSTSAPTQSNKTITVNSTPLDPELSSTNSIMKEHLKNDILSRLYFTYRKSIPLENRIGGKFTSDKGWGCLIRSGQMLMGECLIRLYLGRTWRKEFIAISADENIVVRDGSSAHDATELRSTQNHDSSSKKRSIKSNQRTPYNHKQVEYENTQIALYHYVLRQFFDDPSAPYSIQNICQCGQDKYHKRVGEWFAPTTIAYVLRDLLEHNFQETQLRGIYVADQSVIFLDEIESRFKSKSTHAPYSFKEYNDDFESRRASASTSNELDPFLILLPAKLGMQKLNPIYHESIHRVLQCPQSVGIAGGRRHHSLYFVGFKEQGDLIYFDPHTTQNASQDPETYQYPYDKTGLRCIKLSHVDPSMLIGFLIRDREEFDAFREYASKHFCTKENPIFSIVDTKPSFSITENTVVVGDGDGDDEWLELSADM